MPCILGYHQQMARDENWNDEENARLVAAYFDLLARDLKRIADKEPSRILKKAQGYRAFGGRSKSSVEWKMRNVSSILEELGMPWIKGLAPAYNRQDELWTAVNNFMNCGFDLPLFKTSEPLKLVAAPDKMPARDTQSEHVCSIIRKIDPARRDEENRRLGRLGEAKVFDMELRRLTEVMPKRVPDLKWVARDEGDGHGYDIRSFDERGEDRYIEVKTTCGNRTTPFFISRNERNAAEKYGESYRIFRVFSYYNASSVFVIKPPLDEAVHLEPQVFQASFRQVSGFM